MYVAFILATFSLCSAGHAPYLGQDLNELAEQTKQPSLLPSHVTAKQLAEYQTYHSKFFDIENAYAQGYQAAMRDVQARSIIPRPSGIQSNLAIFPQKRSFIPPSPAEVTKMPRSALAANFVAPKANEITVGGTEKSMIPRPDVVPKNFVDRPVPRFPYPALNNFMTDQRTPGALYQDVPKETRSSIQEPELNKAIDENTRDKPIDAEEVKKRSEIARLNMAARHRNVYFDAMGGDPYTGASGVLSRQNIWLKHRRSVEDSEKIRRVDEHGQQSLLRKALTRRRRSRMPYLGQNLDALGVVRARPNWEMGNRKSSVVTMETVPADVSQYQLQPLFQGAAGLSQVPVPMQISGVARSNIPLQGYQVWAQQNQQQQLPMPSYQQTHLRMEIPAQATFQQQQGYEYAGFNTFYYPQGTATQAQA